MIKACAAFEPAGELREFECDPGPLARILHSPAICGLGSHEVEIDVSYCGICHSDLSMIDNTRDITTYPLVTGHQVVGTVAIAGEAVTNLHAGQQVKLGWHAGYCGNRSHRNCGDHNLCAGAQAQRVVPLPDGIHLQSAGPIFCGSIIVFNPLVQFDVRPTDRVVVIGLGGLGRLHFVGATLAPLCKRALTPYYSLLFRSRLIVHPDLT